MKLKKHDLKIGMIVKGYTAYGTLLYTGEVNSLHTKRRFGNAGIKIMNMAKEGALSVDKITNIMYIETKYNKEWGARRYYGYLKQSKITNWKKFMGDD